jgi:carboxylesterase
MSVEEYAVTVLPGAEPFHHSGDTEVGVLLCHGFTGSPQSLRPWADYLAAAGLTVELPRLPGHGTRWQDMRDTRWEDWYAEVDAALGRVRERCDRVFVTGLSMGGGLALRLAECHAADGAITGLAVVNPSVRSDDPKMALLPVLRYLRPSAPGIGSDIRKPDTYEVAYDRVSLHAAYSLTRFWHTVAADLPKVTQPLLIFRSAHDRVVSDANLELVREKVSSTDVEVRMLPDSAHVATLDHDAPAVFAGSLEFIRRIVSSAGLVDRP